MPELAAGYRTALPAARPVGLRRRRVPAGTELWRVEAEPADRWSWDGFAGPRFRFDPASGAFRTRYAATTLVGAFRERYRPTGLLLPADHAGHQLVRLVAARPLRALDLRSEANLDALGLDDQISTGQHPQVWQTCHRLADAVRRWWGGADAVDVIGYRPRTTPETSVNYAFFALDGFDAESRPLSQCRDVLAGLVLHHGFTVGWS